MAHFAELDDNNTVLRVLVVNDIDTSNENNIEIEAIGVSYLKSLFGESTKWVKTSYNNNIRVRYAVIGGVYDESKDMFIAPCPYPGWLMNEEDGSWYPPVPQPRFGMCWHPERLEWVEPEIPITDAQ
jgi:hypothetical protein